MDTFTPPPGSRVLRLTLKAAPFAVMVTGEKAIEYRRPSDYIKSRLKHTPDYVAFYNGGYTGGGLPWFACKFLGWITAPHPQQLTFSNGLRVEVSEGDYLLLLGPVVATGNLKPGPTLLPGHSGAGRH